MKKLLSSSIASSLFTVLSNIANAQSNCFDYYCINVGEERYLSQPNFNLGQRQVDLDNGVSANISLSSLTESRSLLGVNRLALNTRLSAGNVDAVTSSLIDP